MSDIQAIIGATALILGYMYLGVRLRQFIQPLRIEAAVDGESLIAEPAIPDRTKRNIKSILDQSFSLRTAIIIVSLFPVMWITNLRHPAAGREGDGIPQEFRKDVVNVYRKGIICIVANSPITLTLFLIEMILFQVILPCRNGFSRLVSELQSANRLISRINNFQH